ncbi:MAG TPA: LysR family transcriptional regulator [Candidatus Sulfotelmatobacter sp.]|jgi:DNA-binding transcriptional LysR family regulator|nr:LysR family transcriptional regulator [Candidatus Sulfotelmatobacter sp.]
MKRTDLSDLSAFAAVARHRSFRKAALELGVSPSALSHALRGLEERLGLRLVNRTTRSVALSDAGARLYSRLSGALSDIADMLSDVQGLRTTPSGTLRLNVPTPASRLLLSPMIVPFLSRYPQAQLDVFTENALVDIIAAGYDAGIRFGGAVPQDMVSVRIGKPQGFVIVASPDYLARRDAPRQPRDLKDHPCASTRFANGVVYRWELEKNGEEQIVDVQGPLIASDMELSTQAALDGLCLLWSFEGLVARHIEAGRLIRVMEDWMPPPEPFHLYYPSGRQMSAVLRAFIDFSHEFWR